jgi:hypothetical protein
VSYEYHIPNGQLLEDGELVGTGWSGHDTETIKGMNNPLAISQRGIGPLPPGWYTIEDPVNDTHLGPIAFPLTPDPSNVMYTRAGFYLHAGEVHPQVPDVSSDGCIIQNHTVRTHIAADISGTEKTDPKRRLQVLIA